LDSTFLPFGGRIQMRSTRSSSDTRPGDTIRQEHISVRTRVLLQIKGRSPVGHKQQEGWLALFLSTKIFMSKMKKTLFQFLI
jgi:hypothetical protein